MAGTALAQVATVTIDWNVTHQTIDGFGTSQAAFAPNLYAWPEPQRSQIMDLAFSQANGIGLTIFRSNIRPELEPSKGAWNDYNDPAQVWMMRQAVNRGPVKLFASVWSPPAWMKTEGKLTRGKLKTENYQDFADFLSHYAAEYARANGVEIYAVSMTNEPDNTFDQTCSSDIDCPCNDRECTIHVPCDVDGYCQGWDTCTWDSKEIASFLADYLSPTFAANRIAAKVIAPETSLWDIAESRLSETYNNPTAAARLDIAAGHLYGGSNPSLVFHKALNYGKTIWQTEASIRYDPWDMSGALSWATTIHQGLTAQVSAWVWWVLALWPNYDQNLMSLDDQSTGAFSVSKTFWALGNFSRFIRPGFVRIHTTTSHAPSVLATSAYKDPATGQFVIVAINSGTSDLRVNFKTLGFAGGNVAPYITSNVQNLAPQPAVSLANTITIPAQSIVSYVGPWETSSQDLTAVYYLLLDKPSNQSLTAEHYLLLSSP